MKDDPRQPVAAAPRRGGGDGKRTRRPRRRRTVQRKVILSILLLVVLSTGLCGYATLWVSGRVLRQGTQRNAQLLTDAVARTVAAQVRSGLNRAPADQLEGMTVDTRVAFIKITDPHGRPVAMRIDRPEAWSAYADDGGDDRLLPRDIRRTRRLHTADGDLLIHTEPIWLRGETGDAGDDRLHGYLTLAMVDPTTAQLVMQVRLTMFGCVLLITVLSVLPVVWVVRRWTKPLRQMASQARRLAHGRPPALIDAHSNDEVELLADAFNTMVVALGEARDELMAINADLEKKVEQRTSALQLVNDQLEMQMRDKDEFIRAVTHDLNAPLRNIAGMTKVLLRKHGETVPDEVKTKLERIAANVRNESDMLGDLLDLSRVRTQPGHDQPLELTPLVRELIGALGFEADAKGIDVSIDTPLPVLVADRTRIRQVFQNLIDNAIKYMPDDQPHKRVRIGCIDHDGQPEFFVADTGRGIAPQDHERVFQAFQRARYSGDHEVDGRGVGLASVKSIIEGYGGRIAIDPPRDDRPGTTFRFTIAPQHVSQPLPSSQSAQPVR